MVLWISLFGILSSNVGKCDSYVVSGVGDAIEILIRFERCSHWLANFLRGYEATEIRLYLLCASRQLFDIDLGALDAVPH